MAAYGDEKSEYTHPDYYNLFSDDNYYKSTSTKNPNNYKCYESKVDKDFDAEKNEIIYKLLKSFLNDYQEKKEALRNTSNLVFQSIDLFSYRICRI